MGGPWSQSAGATEVAASSPREARDRPITILCFFLTDQGVRAVRAVCAGGTRGAKGGGGAEGAE